jgi:hypothetical protein
MNRLFAAGLLALPVLLAAGPDARANYPCPHMGCGGFCFKFLGSIHQHGPLYNYGPYTGYYPFEPYGPWNAQLQYTGPYPTPGCGWLCNKCGRKWGSDGCDTCGNGGTGRGRHPWFHKNDCDGCGGWDRYARNTFSNVGHRIFPLFHKNKAKGCDPCGSWSTFAAPAAGCGSCGSCGSKVASANPPVAANPVQQAGYPRTER